MNKINGFLKNIFNFYIFQRRKFRDYEGVLIKKEHFHEKLTEINKGTNKPHLTKERIITNDQFILDSSPYMKFHEKTDNRL